MLFVNEGGVLVDRARNATAHRRASVETLSAISFPSTTTRRSALGESGSAVGLNVSCGDVSTSDVGSVDRTALNDNLQADLLFVGGGDYHLQAASPALDAGPDPATYTGAPCSELDGGPRLRDWDGDGLAESDLGPYEPENGTLVPGEVANIRWTDAQTMQWDAEPSAVEYHVYRDATTSLGSSSFGTCRHDLDPNRADTTRVDSELPLSGQAFFYLIAPEDA